MTTIAVDLGARSYDIVIKDGAFEHAGDALKRFVRGTRAIVVTDETVAALQLPRFSTGLLQAGLQADPIVIPAGEGSKSWAGLETVTEALLARGVERSDTVIALGGGVIGDLVGFAAAILKRGCRFVQVPTTLLAQVDSSVGGKTAINSAAGKNLVGAFHQPVLVLIDPRVLDTLPLREQRAGYAEVVKYGLIDDPAFFSWCEDHAADLLRGDAAARSHAITSCVRAKAAIVGDDERETSGRRALLNLGHTFGHALEAECGYSDKLLHGEAVAAGMAIAFRYSADRGLCDPADARRVETHLRCHGLPASAGEAGVYADGQRLVGHMLHDKKMESGRLSFLLAHGIGQTFLARDVDLADVARFLDADGHNAD